MEFSTKSEVLKSTADNFRTLDGRISAIADDCNETLKNIRTYIIPLQKHIGITAVCSKIRRSGNDMGALARKLDEVAKLYENYEKNVKDKNFTSEAYRKEKIGELLGRIDSLIGGAGNGGSIVSLVYAIINFGKTGEIKDFLKVSKKVLKTVTSVVKLYGEEVQTAAGKVKSTWGTALKRFITNKAGEVAEKPGASWLKAFKSSEAEELAKKGKLPSIIGTAISAVINGIDNYEEYKSGEIDFGRFLTETVVETGIDIVKDVAIAAAFAAAFGTPVGWGAVAIGVGSVVVSMAVDKGTEIATGGEYDSVTELVSDKIVDFSEDAADVILGTYGEYVSNGVKCLDTIKDGAVASWKKAFN